MRLFLYFTLFAQTIFAQINIDNVMNHINVYRKNHNAPPLTYSPIISEFSQSWADHMARTQVFEHSTDSMYGENIAMTSIAGTIALIQSIDMFYNEVELYNYSKPGFYPETGHFTQLVWINTREIGFGVNVSSNGYTYISTNYDPPGNFLNAFNENVKPYITYPTNIIAKEPSHPSPNSPHQYPHPHPSPNSPHQYPHPHPSPNSPHQYPHPHPSSHPHPSLHLSTLPSPPPMSSFPSQPPCTVHIYPLLLPPSYPVQQLNARPSPSQNTYPCYISPRYSLSIKYPSQNKTHVETILCPLIEDMFNEKCSIRFVSSTGIYYGTNPCLSLGVLRQMIPYDIDIFTIRNKLLCGSTISVSLKGGDVFRYLSSRKTCLL